MSQRSTFLAAAVLAGLSSISAFAQTTKPTATGDYSLTIYSTADPATFDPRQAVPSNNYGQRPVLPGYGVVREVRPIELQKGENTLRFTDVAAGIDPTSVSFESLTALDSTGVLEQNYEFDLVSSEKLLEKYIDKAIHLSLKPTGGMNSSRTVDGTLLSSDGGTIVVQTTTGVEILSRQDVASLKLEKTDTGLITKPTLVWKVQSATGGKQDARVTYQTDGLTWRADYNFVINADDTKLDVGAWVTVLNKSGASYPDAKLKLVAGDVQRIQPQQQNNQWAYAQRDMVAKAVREEGFQEKSFFEYHLYTLGRETSLPDNSTKQIELFETKHDVPVKKQFVYYGVPENIRYQIFPSPNQDQNLGTQSNKKVDVYLIATNSEKNGLGMPLPAGRIRVYKQDPEDKTNEFIGEDVIQHTPKDEEIMVKLGSAFDIVGERKQTDFKADYNAHWIEESFEIKLRNHKKEAVSVIIKENLFRWTNWEITKNSDKWEKQDFRTIHIPVDVPVDGEKTVTYTVKYTW